MLTTFLEDEGRPDADELRPEVEAMVAEATRSTQRRSERTLIRNGGGRKKRQDTSLSGLPRLERARWIAAWNVWKDPLTSHSALFLPLCLYCDRTVRSRGDLLSAAIYLDLLDLYHLPFGCSRAYPPFVRDQRPGSERCATTRCLSQDALPRRPTDALPETRQVGLVLDSPKCRPHHAAGGIWLVNLA